MTTDFLDFKKVCSKPAWPKFQYFYQKLPAMTSLKKLPKAFSLLGSQTRYFTDFVPGAPYNRVITPPGLRYGHNCENPGFVYKFQICELKSALSEQQKTTFCKNAFFDIHFH